MNYRIEHIGIAVQDLDLACGLYEKLLGLRAYKREEVASEYVSTAFFATGESKVELLSATDSRSVIAAFLARKGEGIHHIAFQVPDVRIEMARLRQEGFQLLSEEPKPGADNKLVCFVHPKSTGGVLVELCQDIAPVTDLPADGGQNDRTTAHNDE